MVCARDFLVSRVHCILCLGLRLGLLPRGTKDQDTSMARVLFVLDQQKKVRLSNSELQDVGSSIRTHRGTRGGVTSSCQNLRIVATGTLHEAGLVTARRARMGSTLDIANIASTREGLAFGLFLVNKGLVPRCPPAW